MTFNVFEGYYIVDCKSFQKEYIVSAHQLVRFQLTCVLRGSSTVAELFVEAVHLSRTTTETLTGERRGDREREKEREREAD